MRIASILSLLLALATPALAQDSTNAPPPDAAKEGDAQVAPRGAIRSLGRVGRAHVETGVKIPDYGGHIAHPADALPPGTSGPSSSRTYAVPR